MGLFSRGDTDPKIVQKRVDDFNRKKAEKLDLENRKKAEKLGFKIPEGAHNIELKDEGGKTELTFIAPHKPGIKAEEDYDAEVTKMVSLNDLDLKPRAEKALAKVETSKLMENLERLCKIEKIGEVEIYCDGREHYSVKKPWIDNKTLKLMEKGQIIKMPGMECDGKCGVKKDQKFKTDSKFDPAEWTIEKSLLE